MHRIMKSVRHRWLASGGAVLGFTLLPLAAADEVVQDQGGLVTVRRGETPVLVWQGTPLATPKGGAKFAGSAFLHELRTPSGFAWTAVQPADHLHHFGLWWPWKSIAVDGKKYNTWEIQEGQGAHVARGVKQLPGEPGKLAWEFHNEVVVRPAGGPEQPVIRETATLTLSSPAADTQLLDLVLAQQPLGPPVTVTAYRYSGFSWRGPLSWNQGNSKMTTSEGLDRDQANGKPARWVMVSGPTPKGSATVLLMSAATELAGAPEKLRVWDSKNLNGMPFINFNPVQDRDLPLDAAHPAVTKRKYRVLAADRVIDAAAAEAEWRRWLGK
jgi:hypothetical protein